MDNTVQNYPLHNVLHDGTTYFQNHPINDHNKVLINKHETSVLTNSKDFSSEKKIYLFEFLDMVHL